MFDAIIRFSVKRKLFVGFMTLMLFVAGIYAMFTLPVDAVPDITNNQVRRTIRKPSKRNQYITGSDTNSFITNLTSIIFRFPQLYLYPRGIQHGAPVDDRRCACLVDKRVAFQHIRRRRLYRPVWRFCPQWYPDAEPL